MGDPAMQGNPAASAAQHGEKSFPAGTDPAGIQVVSGLPGAPVMAGTPRMTELRMTGRPIEEMGMGFTEVTDGVH